MQIFGAFLAWETRHVSIPALNDSRHVGLSVYNVAIMCICGAAVALVLVDHQDAMFLIIGVFVMFCTTATLWLVFVPKLVELKRNPGGCIDKRIRATLRPMGSKTRRDSSASELESRLKEVKSCNSKYRKTLLEKETELQMLIRRLGAEAKDILDSPDANRLSVPLLRREQPSATETSDITSLCSLSSHPDLASLHRSDSGGGGHRSKKKTTFESSPERPKPQKTPPPVLQGAEHPPADATPPAGPPLQQNGDLSHSKRVLDDTNGRRNSHSRPPDIEDQLPVEEEIVEKEKPPASTTVIKGTPIHERRMSNTSQQQQQPRRRSSAKAPVAETIPIAVIPTETKTTCHRRVSVPNNSNHSQSLANSTSGGSVTSTATLGRNPRVKGDFSGHVVSKSELWDTGNSGGHRCPKAGHGKRVSVSQPDEYGEDEDAGAGMMHHRSVSERNRHGSGPRRERTPDRANSETQRTVHSAKVASTAICNQQCSKLGYYQSTPNVAAIRQTSQRGGAQAHGPGGAPHRQHSIYNATSESELLDREILPIFQKLLTERNKSQHNLNYAYGRSCPNISIKCDIVEYL